MTTLVDDKTPPTVDQPSVGEGGFVGLSGAEWATVFVAVAVATLLAVLPAMVGAMADQPGIGTIGAGYIVSGNTGGIFFGSLIAAALLGRARPRALLTGGLIVMLVGNAITLFVSSLTPLAGARIFAGLGEGVAAGVCYSLMGLARRPALALSYYVAGQSIVGIIGLAVLPGLVASFGWRTFYIGVSVIGLIALPLVRYASASGQRPAPADLRSVQGVRRLPALAMLFSIFLFFSGMALIWAFLQRIGSLQGLSLGVTSAALSTSAALGLVGCLVAGPISSRLPQRLALIGGIVLVGATAGALALPNAFAFFASTWVLSFTWAFMFPFFFRQLAELDFGGGAIAATPMATGIALSVGPAVGGLLIARAGLNSAIIAFLALCIVALLACLALQAARPKVIEQEAP